jgi:DNA end-binding protein Ku
MAARAISSGTICFGLVSIPVKVYSAISSQTVRFNTLDREHHQWIKQQFVSAKTGEVVPRADTVKGYEYAKGQYVVFTDEELKALERASDGAMEIAEFVPIEQVDPIYFEKTNFLGPDKGGQKAYLLLQQAMRDAGKVAIGRWSARGRQQLVLIRPYGVGLALHGLYHADEVRSIEDVDIDLAIEIGEGELDLAQQLIDQLTTKTFDPARYEDEYRARVLEAIDRKVAGDQIVVAEREESREQIIDLVAALKKSLSERDEGAPAKRPARKAAKAKKSARKKASRSK